MEETQNGQRNFGSSSFGNFGRRTSYRPDLQDEKEGSSLGAAPL
jgi:hypothetical protein